MIKDYYFDKVIYRKRFPPLPATNHLQLVIKELGKKYSVIFHDDDLMEKNYVAGMLEFMERNCEYLAACPNAYIMRGNKRTSQKFYPNASPITIIQGSCKVARNYIDLSKFRMPFPGYIYRSEQIKKISISNKEGGKHIDVSFLMKIGALGKIAWIGSSLMSYRIHEKNDTMYEDVYGRLSRLRFIYRNTVIKSSDPDIAFYKMAFWFLWLLGKKSNESNYKRKIIIKYLVFSIPLNCILHPIKALTLLKNRFYYIHHLI